MNKAAAMPRKRQPKALAAIQEDEVMEEEEQAGSRSHPINEQLALLLEEMEQQGRALLQRSMIGRADNSLAFANEQCTISSTESSITPCCCAISCCRQARFTELLPCFPVLERAQALLDQADEECRALRNEFAVQLVKLPKQVV